MFSLDWVAPTLKNLLFDDIPEKSVLRTYLVLDATQYSEANGMFDLDTSNVDVPIRCLFKGEAAQELEQAHPTSLT